jgi:hypothetical protein
LQRYKKKLSTECNLFDFLHHSFRVQSSSRKILFLQIKLTTNKKKHKYEKSTIISHFHGIRDLPFCAKRDINRAGAQLAEQASFKRHHYRAG